ncbi:MAG: hypothetical protein ACRCW4_05795 [Candidatus Neomicrothrix subdominans]
MAYPSEKNQDAWRDANRHLALSQEEVAALDVGTAVVVTWSGGNGPHRYIVDEQILHVGTYLRVEGREHFPDRGKVQGPVTFVGPERYHTHVILAADSRVTPTMSDSKETS